MKRHVLLNTVIDSTDQIYSYMYSRVCKPRDELVLSIKDMKVISEFDGVENFHNMHVDDCYEYFLGRISVGINYFLNKVNYTDQSLIIDFRKYLFSFFLKSLVVDYNRKLTGEQKRNDRKRALLNKIYVNRHRLTQSEFMIIELYGQGSLTQEAIAKNINKSKATVHRAIKKLESL